MTSIFPLNLRKCFFNKRRFQIFLAAKPERDIIIIKTKRVQKDIKRIRAIYSCFIARWGKIAALSLKHKKIKTTTFFLRPFDDQIWPRVKKNMVIVALKTHWDLSN